MPERIDLTADAYAQLVKAPLGKVDLWGKHREQGPLHAYLDRNRFKYKSLSSWAYNIAMGCNHACRFCYVPSQTTKKYPDELKLYGVTDADAEWGEYVLLRRWDEKKFRNSVKRAMEVKAEELNPDGNRAVILCSTTDPYQTVVAAGDAPRQTVLNTLRQTLVRRALEMILDESDLNVRILTRSPLAKQDFDLYKRFGHRLVFGMSLPTLNDDLRKRYEPKAPGVQKRLDTLKQAKDMGLHVYIAMAPTSPECQEDDLRATLTKIKEFKPITIFHEPINLRAENFARIAKHAADLKVNFNKRPLLKENWAAYALWQLQAVEGIANELSMGEQLHLWPDKTLGKRNVWNHAMRTVTLPTTDLAYHAHVEWLAMWWNRISEWPQAPKAK